MRFYVT